MTDVKRREHFMRRVITGALIGLALTCALATLGLAGPARSLGIQILEDKVGRYEKVEMEIRVDGRYDNPFDPDVVDVIVSLKSPDGRQITLPAFYCQPYERRRLGQSRNGANWYYPVGMGTWKARFAPMQTGTYLATATLRDRAGAVQSDSVRFDCVPSSNKGFLRASREDPRYLEFTTGGRFFPIGQNLAFIGEGQYVNLTKAEEIFGKLGANGANFLRIWTCCKDWAMAIEARKSAWDRSWQRNAPIEPCPAASSSNGDEPLRRCVRIGGNGKGFVTVSPSHPVALRPGTRYALSGRFMAKGPTALRVNLGRNSWELPCGAAGQSEWRRFSQEFVTAENEFRFGRTTLSLVGSGTVWLGELSLKEVPDGPELLWEADVNRPVRGFYNQLDCFMLDEIVEAARSNGIYLMLCVLTRDLYMASLSDDKSVEYDRAIRDAEKFMRYAVGRWGYSTHVAAWEYFNEMNPSLPTDRFYAELGEYLERIDVYHHLRTTSTWAPSARDCRLGSLDIAQLHHYMRPETKEEFKDEVAVVLDQAKFLRTHAPDKPALIGEFGLATPKWGLSDYMKQDKESVHFHNSLWASAFAGVSGTAMFWWWDQLDRQNAYGHYRPLAAFFADVSLSGLHAMHDSAADGSYRWLGYTGKDRAYLWIADTQATWWNQVVDEKQPAQIEGAIVTIQGLDLGDYRVEWWGTYEGKIIRTDKVSLAEGSLQISVPSFQSDIACKVSKVSN
ncbi:MAG: DUF5060 domain-containing protein [Sedimentisphaerales bacterium]